MAKKGALETAATQHLAQLNIPFAVHQFESSSSPVDDLHSPTYARDAAAILGVDPHRFFDMWVVKLTHAENVVVAIPATTVLDLAVVAASVGRDHAEFASDKRAAKFTGEKDDSRSVLALPEETDVLIDISVFDHQTVFVAAGRPGYAIELSSQDLVNVTGARTAPIVRYL